LVTKSLSPSSTRRNDISKPVLPQFSTEWSQRADTIQVLYQKLQHYKLVQVRGTPASGKTILLHLLWRYINAKDPQATVHPVVVWPEDKLINITSRLQQSIPGSQALFPFPYDLVFSFLYMQRGHIGSPGCPDSHYPHLSPCTVSSLPYQVSFAIQSSDSSHAAAPSTPTRARSHFQRRVGHNRGTCGGTGTQYFASCRKNHATTV